MIQSAGAEKSENGNEIKKDGAETAGKFTNGSDRRSKDKRM